MSPPPQRIWDTSQRASQSSFAASYVAKLSLHPSRLGGDHLLLSKRCSVKEGLHRSFSEAPAPLMRAHLVVLCDPRIKVGLQFGDRTVNLFPERNSIELVERALVKAF